MENPAALFIFCERLFGAFWGQTGSELLRVAFAMPGVKWALIGALHIKTQIAVNGFIAGFIGV